MARKSYWFVLLMVAAMTMVGCSGSGEETGTGFDTVSIGTASNVNTNALRVNGTNFNTANATIKVDDNPSPSDLKEGMVVVVSGSVDDNGNGTATSVTAKAIIQGQIAGYSADTGGFTIMGFDVVMTDATVVAQGVTLANGEFVKVSGYLGTSTSVNATRIDTSNNAAGVKITGQVTGLDGNTFNIGTQQVDYSGVPAGELANHFPGGIQDNMFVEVRGLLNGNVLEATKVELHGTEIGNIAKAHIDGHILSIQAGGFTLTNGQVVETNGNTAYINGVEADLAVGMEIEVEGPVSGGILTAIKVKFKDNIKLRSLVESVNNDTIVLKHFSLTINTSFAEAGKVETVNVNDEAEIRGYRGSNGQINALEVRFRGTNTTGYRVILQGPVTAVNQPDIDILNNTVSGATEYRDRSDASITQGAFFSAVQIGSVVKAQGDESSGGVSWKQLEIE